ncbi:hypothetical protein [Actinophytocola sp.]|uniref:hypothetical protein n=1 Tax=Actinophytocola sp. TaxID=1872138 RepID=UPI00389A50FE
MFTPGVPGDAPLVVRTKPGTRALYVALLGAVVLQVLAVAGMMLLALWSPVLFAFLPLAALQFWFVGRILREYQGLLGPQLAADHTGVWVRTGAGPNPQAVYLPWAAIEGVDAVRGPAVRITSRHGEGLLGQHAHWRVRALRRRFNSAFVVDGRRSAEPADQIVHRLWQLAEWARGRS